MSNSFVPIKPKDAPAQPPISGLNSYLKSIVCSIPTRATNMNNQSQANNLINSLDNIQKTKLPNITLVSAHKSKQIMPVQTVKLENDESNSMEANEHQKEQYLESRKRKRKQDLSNLKTIQLTNQDKHDLHSVTGSVNNLSHLSDHFNENYSKSLSKLNDTIKYQLKMNMNTKQLASDDEGFESVNKSAFKISTPTALFRRSQSKYLVSKIKY
jgi:hypothetical protein